MKSAERGRIARDLAEQLPAYAAKGALIFRRPIGSSLAGLYIEDSAVDPRSFFVWVFFLPLYVPTTHLSFNFGMRIRRTEGGERWNADEPNEGGLLLYAVREQALPFLNGLGSPSAIANTGIALCRDRDPYVQQIIAYTWARFGDAPRASFELRQLRAMLDDKVPWQKEVAERASFLLDALATSPDEVRRQMDMWELETSRHLGLLDLRSSH